VTRQVCEKFAQDIAPSNFCQKKHITFAVENSRLIIRATSVIPKKLSKVYNNPIGENSSKLVTLAKIHVRYLDNGLLVFTEGHFQAGASVVEGLGGVAALVLLSGPALPFVEETVHFVDFALKTLQLRIVRFALLSNKIGKFSALKIFF
jgi:hypothetical protein